MYFLGTDYIVSSIIWLLIIFFIVFAFRKYILKRKYGKPSFDLFISKLNIYLEKTYPDIKFDLSIIKATETNENPDDRKFAIVDEVLKQYKNILIQKSKLPQSTPQDLQWSSYIFNSTPNKDKLPKDWIQRKNALMIRDHKKCLRCSTSLEINTMQIHMLRSLEQNGTYHLENLIPVCKDCEIILSKNSKKISHLKIKEELNRIVQESFI